MAGHVAHIGGRSDAFRVFLGNPEGRRPIGRPGHKWKYNIKMNLQHVGFGRMDWIALVQERDGWRVLVNAVMNLRVPSTARIFLTG
jgi:hypothetical protein